jgi:hypothetical protein
MLRFAVNTRKCLTVSQMQFTKSLNEQVYLHRAAVRIGWYSRSIKLWHTIRVHFETWGDLLYNFPGRLTVCLNVLHQIHKLSGIGGLCFVDVHQSFKTLRLFASA